MDQHKVVMGRYERKHSQDCLNLIKKSLKIIVGIRIGCCRPSYHLGNLGISADTVCKFYEENDETYIHSFMQCKLKNLEGYFIRNDRSREHMKIPVGNYSQRLSFPWRFVY